MELLQKLGVEPLVLIAQVVNFGILLGALWVILYRPVLRLLEQRRKTIEEGLANAKEYEEKKQWLKREVEKIIADAEAQSHRIKLAATEAAERIQAEAKQQSQNERANYLAAAHEQLARERHAALAGLERDIRELALLAAEKIVGDSWSPKTQENLIATLTRERLKRESN